LGKTGESWSDRWKKGPEDKRSGAKGKALEVRPHFGSGGIMGNAATFFDWHDAGRSTKRRKGRKFTDPRAKRAALHSL